MLDERTDRTSVAGLECAEPGRTTGAARIDLACDDFAVLAETQRRAGRPAEARRIAEDGLADRPRHIEGRVALGLALMDMGDLDAAREVLSGALLPAAAQFAEANPAPSQPLALASESPSPSLSPSPSPSQLGAPDDFEIDQAFEQAVSDPSEMMDVNQVAERVLDQEMEAAFGEGVRHETFDESPRASVADALSHEPAPTAAPTDDVNAARVLATLEMWRQNIRRQVA